MLEQSIEGSEQTHQYNLRDLTKILGFQDQFVAKNNIWDNYYAYTHKDILFQMVKYIYIFSKLYKFAFFFGKFVH